MIYLAVNMYSFALLFLVMFSVCVCVCVCVCVFLVYFEFKNELKFYNLEAWLYFLVSFIPYISDQSSIAQQMWSKHVCKTLRVNSFDRSFGLIFDHAKSQLTLLALGTNEG